MRIHYAGGSELTGTAIADALLDLAEELGRTGGATTVEIPVRQADGSVGRSRFLLGPASQIVAETEDSDLDEVSDEEVVRDLAEQANALRLHPVLQAEAADTVGWDPDTEVDTRPGHQQIW